MHQLGITRSALRREYLLHTPDAFVRTPLPGLSGGQAIVHIAPQMGARFAMTTIELDAHGSLQAGATQRFVYVLSGSITLHPSAAQNSRSLEDGAFCLLPASDDAVLTAATPARILLIEKPYAPLPGANSPSALFGEESSVPATALNGDDDLQVRCLIPNDPAFDFAVNTMTYAPGAALSQVEVHYMEHGLLMLQGGGIYRLNDDWHPVQAGDAIWMRAFCPQWFAAVGKQPAKYIIYKDFNRHVLA